MLILLYGLDGESPRTNRSVAKLLNVHANNLPPKVDESLRRLRDLSETALTYTHDDALRRKTVLDLGLDLRMENALLKAGFVYIGQVENVDLETVASIGPLIHKTLYEALTPQGVQMVIPRALR
jgi:hypothetical protein